MTKKIYILIFFLSCISAIQTSAFAQKATVKATVQPVEIAIGQQSVMNLEVIAPKGRNIVFPVYKDTLVHGIEVLDMFAGDTVYAHQVMTITQKYLITSFDSALYHVPYIPVWDGTDTILSNGFGLKVTSPILSDATMSYLEEMKANPGDSVDLEKLGVYDIKAIQTPDFVWKDYIIYGLILLSLLLAIMAVIIGLYMYRKKKETGSFFKPKVVLPPHIIALDALNHIREEKLWQQGREKEYFTELTDILRGYIQKRFHVSAFEMTSNEILSIINNFVETGSSSDSLKQVLKLADLVKFAKYKPLPNENDLSMVNSVLFVTQTKKEDPAPLPEGGEQPSDGDDTEVAVRKEDNKETKKEDKPHENGDTPIDWTIPRDQYLKDYSSERKKNNK